MGTRRFAGLFEQRRAAIQRDRDAFVLREKERWLGAMYLQGYAVECALKARLMERLGCLNLDQLAVRLQGLMNRKQVNLYVHSLDLLMEYTGGSDRVGQRPELRSAWGVVRCWSVDWRYSPTNGDKGQCERFFNAVEKVRRFIEHSI